MVTLTLFNAPLRDQREYERLCEIRLQYHDAMYIGTIGVNRQGPTPDVAVSHLRIEVERSWEAIDLAPQDIQLQPGDVEVIRGVFQGFLDTVAPGMPAILEKVDRLAELLTRPEDTEREPWQGDE